jgi:hypothetical protein
MLSMAMPTLWPHGVKSDALLPVTDGAQGMKKVAEVVSMSYPQTDAYYECCVHFV